MATTKKPGTEQVPNQIIMLNLDELDFDYENPRLPLVKRSDQEGDVLKYMLKEAKVTDLMLSIGEQGFFSGEPILVVRNPKGGYTVVEGNRRLSALKLLHNPEKAPVLKERVSEISEKSLIKPTKIPAVLYEERNSLLGSLGFRHITGVDEWTSLAKARYVSTMLDAPIYDGKSYNDKLRAIARIIGSRADYVSKILTAYRLYNQIFRNSFYKIPTLDEENIQFSYLTTALSYNSLIKFLELNDDGDGNYKADDSRLRELTEWFFKGNENGITPIVESRNIKLLSSIVESNEALKVFRQTKNVQEAVLFTSAPTESFNSLVNKGFRDISNAYKLIGEMNDKIETTENIIDLIKRIKSTLENLIVVIEGKTKKQ